MDRGKRLKDAATSGTASRLVDVSGCALLWRNVTVTRTSKTRPTWCNAHTITRCRTLCGAGNAGDSISMWDALGSDGILWDVTRCYTPLRECVQLLSRLES